MQVVVCVCVKQKLQILLRANHSGACARRKRHVLRFLWLDVRRETFHLCLNIVLW